MALLLLLLLDSSQVSAGQWLVDGLHTYDVLAYEVDAAPTASGLDVLCRLKVRAERAGPLTFLLSGAVEGLTVTCGDAGVPHEMRGLDTLLRVAGAASASPPALLTLEPETPLQPGEEATFQLRYRWRPPPGGWFRAGADGVETHLSSFWLPTMADEFFSTSVRVHTDLAAFAPGQARRTEEGWLFEGESEQILPLLVADLVRIEGEGCEVWLPPALRGEGEAIARDLAAVIAALDRRFGPAGEGPFRLVVAPENGVPSYCAGSFAVVKWRSRDRARWIQHLAHECAHRWFGHRLATPVIGRGGTWLREGLAEWAGIEVAGELLEGDAARGLWRERFARYISQADLRRLPEGVLFVNESTLLDATYLDDPEVPYSRGALVLRLMAREPGFREGLRALLEGGPGRILGASEVLSKTGGEGTAAYYAGTTRLPDLRLLGVTFGEAAVRGRIVCDDTRWPGGRVPVRVETTEGPVFLDVEVRGGEGALLWEGTARPLRVELDPERLYLDPVRSNGIAERPD